MLNTQIQKYKYTTTQIQHNTKCQKDPACGIFLERGLFKDIKNHIPMCYPHQHLISHQMKINICLFDLSEFDISDNLEWLTDFCVALSHRFISFHFFCTFKFYEQFLTVFWRGINLVQLDLENWHWQELTSLKNHLRLHCYFLFFMRKLALI